MAAKYEPGTIARATVLGKTNVRVIRSSETDPFMVAWLSGELVDGTRGHSHDDVTDVRVLPVLDMHEDDLHALVEWLRAEADPTIGSRLDRLAACIEDVLAPPPPEPTELGATVRLTRDRMAVRRSVSRDPWLVVALVANAVPGDVGSAIWADIAADVITEEKP